MWKPYINPKRRPLPWLTTTSVATDSECAPSDTNIGWEANCSLNEKKKDKMSSSLGLFVHASLVVPSAGGVPPVCSHNWDFYMGWVGDLTAICTDMCPHVSNWKFDKGKLDRRQQKWWMASRATLTKSTFF